MTEQLGEGKYLRLLRDGRWEYAARIGVDDIVMVVTLTDDDELVLVEQYRPAVGAAVVDFPAGLVDPGERPADAALRELTEETGYVAERVEFLARATPSPGLSSEVVTFYRAHGLRKVGAGGGDDTENIKVHVVPRAGIREFLARMEQDGALVDAKLWAGLYFTS